MTGSERRSRRELLGVAIGAAATGLLSHAAPAAAADGDTLKAGGDFTSDRATSLTSSGDVGLAAIGTGGAGGLRAHSDSGIGVKGGSSASNGVLGTSSTNTAIYGSSGATDHPAIQGQSTGNSTGVLGWSGTGTPPAAPSKTGVFGFANQSAGCTGVFGQSSQGTGVAGSSSDGYGVTGASVRNAGVLGTSQHIGVQGEGDRTGVHGFAAATNGVGVLGVSNGTGMQGTSFFGVGVAGASVDSNDATTGVLGWSGAFDPPPPPAKTGVFGFADQDAGAVGVRGTSNKGRGGIFKGGKAQLRLIPSSAASHPPSGQKGDLFVDRSGRLWFYNGATWARIA